MRLENLDRMERVAELLASLFYALLAVALLAALVGSTGSALLLLVIGAGVHVVRFSLELFVDERGASASGLQVAGRTLRRQ